jgi:hypothetical protein
MTILMILILMRDYMPTFYAVVDVSFFYRPVKYYVALSTVPFILHSIFSIINARLRTVSLSNNLSQLFVRPLQTAAVARRN